MRSGSAGQGLGSAGSNGLPLLTLMKMMVFRLRPRDRFAVWPYAVRSSADFPGHKDLPAVWCASMNVIRSTRDRFTG